MARNSLLCADVPLRNYSLHSCHPANTDKAPLFGLQALKYMSHTRTHTHSVLKTIFPGEPGLAGCPLNSHSPFIPGLCMLLGQS